MRTVGHVMGSLVGLAVCDALGTTLEFTSRDAQPPVTDIVGGGPFGLKPGEWTDDTSMALCLAASIVGMGGFDLDDQMRRYGAWRRDGYMSSNGRCFDIGGQTRQAISDFEHGGPARRTDVESQSSGNGSLMRLAPVPMAYGDPHAAAILSAESSSTTHASQECLDACFAFGHLLAVAMTGVEKSSLLADWSQITWRIKSPSITTIIGGSYAAKDRAQISSSGYVVHSLEAALWAFASTDNFADGAIAAANLGDDADTVAAIYGQLGGAFYGIDAIPFHWIQMLAHRETILDLAHRLAFGQFPTPLIVRMDS